MTEENKKCEMDYYYPRAPWSAEGGERRCGHCYFDLSKTSGKIIVCPKCGYTNYVKSIGDVSVEDGMSFS